MREARRALGIPTLAMVDAFVGGVAVILILTILSSLSSERTATIPVADRVVTCTGPAGFAVSDPAGPLAADLDSLAPTLARLAPPEALSMRVLLEARPEDAAGCVAHVTRIVSETNAALDAGTLPYPAPVLVLDIAYVAGDRSAGGAPDAD